MRSKQISINVGDYTYGKLTHAANVEGRSISNYVANVLIKHFTDVEGNEPQAPLPDAATLFAPSKPKVPE